MLICPRLPCFLRGEGKNTATPCRNIFHAMRLEGCKEFFWWPPSKASFSAKTPQILLFAF